MSKSSLSEVVSDLVRAQMGSSVSNTVTDEDLDRTVAELIVKEAKQKAERYLQDGVRAYLPQPESNAPKPNKRFLSSIIRNTDDHNKAVLKAQADAALEAKVERDEQERRERRIRANEATDAERLRRLMGGSRRGKDDGWSRDRDRNGSRRERSRERRDRSVEGRDRSREKRSRHSDNERTPERSHKSKRRRSRERSDDHDHERRRRRHDREQNGDDSEDHRRRRHRSRSDSRSRSNRKHHSHRSERYHGETDEEYGSKTSGRRAKPARSPSVGSSRRREKSSTPTVDTASVHNGKSKTEHSTPVPERITTPQPDLTEQFRSRKDKEKERELASPTLSEEEDIERLRPRKKRTTLHASTSRLQDDPNTPDSFSSKMDKYFEASYDPRLDHGPLTIPEVPSTGLINGDEFEGWEAMLEVIRQRREYKAEKKRVERLGLSLESEREKEKRKQDTWGAETGDNIMDIKYSKKGAVREWDMGKEGF